VLNAIRFPSGLRRRFPPPKLRAAAAAAGDYMWRMAAGAAPPLRGFLG